MQITLTLPSELIQAIAAAVAAAMPAPIEAPKTTGGIYTIKETAKLLRRSEKFVRGEITKGRLRADNCNRNTPLRPSWRVRESDIQTYLKGLRKG